jgi:hypothetical protein
MVWRPEGSHTSSNAGVVKNTGNGVNGDDFERFFFAECGKNARHAARQHRLSRPRRSNQQNVVPAGSGDLQGAFRPRLPDDIRKIRRVRSCSDAYHIRAGSRKRSFAQLLHQLTQTLRRG